jgi:two-component system, OmpR family, sensor histidine kinase SenX3
VNETQRREFYDIMLADTYRLQQTVEQVLKAGVAGQRVGLQHHAPVDIGALAAEVTETARLRHHLPADTMTVAIVPPSTTGLFVDGDADELRTVLSNLLDNAVKYSRDRVQVAVEVAAPSPDTVWVRVKDRGIGIPRAQLRRIFNRFYRFQTRGFNVKGTGLGLYIVRSIVKQHGGRVFAASEGEGQGATFTVELPRLVRAEAEHQEPRALRAGT